MNTNQSKTLGSLLTALSKSSVTLLLAFFVLVAMSAASQAAQVVKWDISTYGTGGTSPQSETSKDANVTIGGLTRGSGLTAITTAKAWGASGFSISSSTAAAAITANNFITFTITANSTYKVSLSDIAIYNIRRSGTGPTTGIWQYKVGAGSFTDIGSSITYGSTTTSTGNDQAAITLSGISDLQNVAAGTTITFRLVSWGATGTAGTWGFNDQTSGSRDLIVNGTVASAATATITGGTTAGSAFTTTYGTASSSQSFSVSGANLTADLVATAGTGFEVSTDNSTFANTATYTQSGGSASGTVYARLKATAAVSGSYNSVNAVVLSSTGATSANIVTTSSGNAVSAKALSVTASAQSKTYGSTLSLGTSAFTSSGLANSETIGGVTLTANGGTAATDAATTYTITPSAATGGTFTAGNYSITYNTGVLTVNPKALTITANNVTKVAGTTLSSPVTGSTAFGSVGLANSETIGSVTITYGSGKDAGDAVGTYTGSVVPSAATGGTFTPANYSISYVAGDLEVSANPTISVSGTLSAVNTTYGTASASPTSFSVSGANLTGDLTVTPPSGFEVSTSVGSGYSTSLNLTQSGGTVSSTTIYVRLAATTAAGTYSGNITVSGGGATSQTIATASSTVAQATLTISGLSGVNKTYDGTTSATFTGTPAYVGLVNGESFSVTGTGAAAFATAAAGNGKTVNITGYTAPSANYTMGASTVTADVSQAPLTITANNVSKTEGATLSSPVTGSTAFTSSGLVNSETIGTVTITYGSGAAAGDAPGTYTGSVTPSAATGGTFSAANYSITYTAGNLTVNPLTQYRSTATGNWNATATWESSTDGGSTWGAAAATPTSADGAITIRNGNVVTVSAAVTADQVTVASGGTLGLTVALTLANGTGDDLVVQNGGILLLNTTSISPTYNVSATARINSGGTVKVTAGSLTANGAGANNPNITYDSGAILEFANAAGVPSSGNVTFFSAADASTIPVLKFTALNGSWGATTPTIVNGVVESATGVSLNVQSSGPKTFRNGLRGAGNISQGTAGAFYINGATAELGVAGTLTIGGSGLFITNGVTTPQVTVTANGTLSGGAITNGGSIDLNGKTLSGTTLLIFTNGSGVLKGSGTYAGAVTVTNGTLSPGGLGAVGSITVGSPLSFQSSGTNIVDISAATGTAGSDWDLVTVSSPSTLNINSTSGAKYTLRIRGTPTGFNPDGTYTWLIVGAATINNFDVSKFTIDTNDFVGARIDGTFSVQTSGSGLELKYVGVPACTPPTITLGSATSVCTGSTSSSLSYSGTTQSPNQYYIDWNGAANTAGFSDTTYATLPASPIPLTVPAGAAAGTYNGTIYVKNTTTGCESAGSTFSITLNGFSVSTSTLINETVGSPSGTTTIAAYNTANGWSSVSPISFDFSTSLAPDVRSTTASSGYSGASGGGNVFFAGGSGERDFIVSGINTLGYNGLVFSFGLKAETLVDGDPFIVQYSTNGSDWVNVSFTQPTSTSGWNLITPSVTLPQAENLQLRFAKNLTSSWRLDDIKITKAGISSAPTLTYNQAIGTTFRISVAELLANVSGPNATVVAVSSTSTTLNNPVSFGGGIIGYPTAVTASDSFTYTLQSTATGCQSTGTINITAYNATSQTTGSITLSGGDAVLTFFGIPNATYTLQRSGDLSTWTDVTTVTADSHGVISYTDVGPTPPVYYRLKY